MPSFSSRVPPGTALVATSLTHLPGVWVDANPIALRKNTLVPDPDCGMNALIAPFRPPTLSSW